MNELERIKQRLEELYPSSNYGIVCNKSTDDNGKEVLGIYTDGLGKTPRPKFIAAYVNRISVFVTAIYDNGKSGFVRVKML